MQTSTTRTYAHQRLHRTQPTGPSWAAQSWPLRILRAFLGVTFVYAGAQKLADPNFLRAGTPDYIGSQLVGFERGSPIAFALRIFGHAPVLTGLGLALLEIAIGLATLAGVAALTAAASGALLNVILFLSATWHVHPYFLGSDSMYAVAWIAYLVGVVEERRRATATPRRGTRHQREAARSDVDTPLLGRREFLRGAGIGVGTLAIAAGAATVAGSPSRSLAAGLRPTPSVSPPHVKKPAVKASPKASPAVAGKPVAKLDSIPVGGAVGFDAPGDGTPCVLLRLARADVAAFSRVCTHAGCLVGYDQASRILVCPCHGAEFDPSHDAQPVAGPAPTPLPRVPVAIDPATGNVVVTS